MDETKQVTVIEPTITNLNNTGQQTSKKRVAAYARVSTLHEEQESSFDAQVEYYTKYIQSNPNWEFVGIYADNGISGTSTKRREGFNLMVEDAKAGKMDMILTKSISRFARNTVDTLKAVRELRIIGCEVVFEKENLSSFSPQGDTILTIMANLAEEESRSLSESVKWGKRRRMQAGKTYIPYHLFLGYRKGADGKPEIVPEEAEIVREIFQMSLNGASAREIAKELTERGIPSPGKCKKWHPSSISKMLRNEKYKGDALCQKVYTVDFLTKKRKKNEGELRQYYIKNSHPAIIDEETFDKVQKELDRRRTYEKK